MRGGRGPSPVETHGQQSAPRPSLAYPPLNPHRTAHRGAGTPGTRGVGWGGGGRLLGFLLGVNRPCVTLQNRPPPPFFATPPNFVSLPRIEKVPLKLRPSGNFAKKPRILQKSLVFCKALAAPRQVSGRGGGGGTPGRVSPLPARVGGGRVVEPLPGETSAARAGSSYL